MSHPSDVPVPRRARLIGLATLTLLVFLPAGARGQDHRFSVTGYLGSAAYGNLAGELDPGVMLEPGGFYGGMAELWFGRFGARLHGGLARTPLEDEPETGFDLQAADIDLVARLRRPRPGLFFQPYAVLGFGAVRYDLGEDTSLVGGFGYESDPTTRAAMVLGLGTDLGGGPVAVRIELMDIIGFSSPLIQDDGTEFGPVPHVVLILGLSFRFGSITLPPPEPAQRRPPTTRLRPTEQPDTVRRPPRDTTPRDTMPADTVERRPEQPVAPPIDTTVTPITAGPEEETPEDSTPRLRPGPPRDTAGVLVRPRPTIDTAGPPPDTVTPPVDITAPPPDTTDPVVERPRPPITLPPVDTGVPVDTTTPPTDSVVPPPTDTTPPVEPPTDTTEPPVDTTGPPVQPPVDTADGGDDETRGRLFTVRVAWDPDDPEAAAAMGRLVTVLDSADVIMWLPEPDPDGGMTHRRVAALRNAADARVLGNHIQAVYGLAWEWVHIERDVTVPPGAVEASTAFVDALGEEGVRPGRPRGPGA